MGAGQVHGPGGEHGAQGEARDTGGGHPGPAGRGVVEITSISFHLIFYFRFQIRKKNADEKLQLLNKLLVGIKSGLEVITHKLYAGKC